MNIYYCANKHDFKNYALFRYLLYKNDLYYCYTDIFIFEMLLYKQTEFARSCVIKPILAKEGEKILAQAMLIHNPKDDFVQVSYFEALPDQQDAADLIIDEAKKFAQSEGVKRIIIGLDGHLSYAVGLSIAMIEPNSFGASYTKTYYREYFKNYTSHKLVAYTNSLDEVVKNVSAYSNIKSNLTVRTINMKDFKNEMDIFGDLCDKTIGTTYLYTKTDKNHFYELMKDMTFFLKKENILFVYDKEKPVGFVFWNPDYNEVMPKGKKLGLLDIAFHYTFKKKKITRATLNSIGVLEEYRGAATALLFNEIKKYITQDYYKNIKTFESSFVWQDNTNSMLLNKLVLKNVLREFEVFEINL